MTYIVTVVSSDGATLYTPVKAESHTQLQLSQETLKIVAKTKTKEELLEDGYFLTRLCAAAGVPCAECRKKIAA